jgi:hypothetical protein
MIRHCYYDKTDNTIHNVVVEEGYDDLGLRYYLMDYSWDIDLENTRFYYEDNEEDQRNNNYYPPAVAPKVLLMRMKADLQTKIADLKNQLDLLNIIRIEE